MYLLVELMHIVYNAGKPLRGGKPSMEMRVTKAKKQLSVCLNWLKKNAMKITIALIAGYAASKLIGPLVALVSAYFETEPEELENQSGHSGRQEPKVRLGKPVKLGTSLKPVLIRGAKFQSGDFEIENIQKFTSTDLNLQRNVGDVVSTMFNKWFYMFYLVDNTDPSNLKFTRIGHTINVVGAYFLMPYHFIYQISDQYKNMGTTSKYVLFSSPNKRKTFRFNLEDFLSEVATVELAGNQDYCLFFNNQAQLTASGCIKFFLKQNDIRKLEAQKIVDVDIFGSYVPGSESDRSLVLRNTRTRAKCMGGSQLRIKPSWQSDFSHYTLDQLLEYKGNFGPGDCGSLIISSDPHFDCRKILGIH
jgi:hypothetical protein